MLSGACALPVTFTALTLIGRVTSHSHGRGWGYLLEAMMEAPHPTLQQLQGALGSQKP